MSSNSLSVNTLVNQSQTPMQNVNDIFNWIVMTILVLGVGFGAGYGTLAMLWMFDSAHKFLFEDKLWGLLNGFGIYCLLIVPAIGGLIVGTLIIHFAREVKGQSIPITLKTLVAKDVYLSPRALMVKSLSSALCAGSCGSVGLGSPIAQFGAAIGSTIGQFFHVSKYQLRLLITCGAGAGIAAVFHAPIVGAFFALEVVQGKFKASNFLIVLISALVADAVVQSYNPGSFLIIPQYTQVSHWELLLYATLGVFTAISAIAFIRTMGAMKKLWDRMSISEYLKPALGGLVLGAIGLLTFQVDGLPRIFGLGTSTIIDAINGSLALNVILVLFLMKILATSLILGSGNAGGTITPSFFMGAMLGGTFGHIVNLLFPTIVAPTGAYALAGMAAFFGSAMGAPITAIVVAIELIGGYQINWPIILTILVSTFVTSGMNTKSLFNTLKWIRRRTSFQVAANTN